MTERKTKGQSARRSEPRTTRKEQHQSADELAAARQRARDRAGDEGLPRSSGAPKRSSAS